MCSHYEAPTPSQLADAFGIEVDPQGKLDLWPGYIGPFLRRSEHEFGEDGEGAPLELLSGSFGLIPGGARTQKLLGAPTTLGLKPWLRSRRFVMPGGVSSIASWSPQRSTSRIGEWAKQCQQELREPTVK